MSELVKIDGGAGGGQILRTALALSTLTGIPCRISNIRENRPTPGLRPQHQQAVSLLANIAQTRVEPLESTTSVIEFRPQGFEITDGNVDIGTAGSVSLLLQSVLPLAYRSQQPVRITVTGGTDVKWSPPIDYFKNVFLPSVNNFGIDANLSIEKTGFYPKGGGKATLTINTSSTKKCIYDKRDSLNYISIYSKASADLLHNDVATRQAKHAVTVLETLGHTIGDVEQQHVNTASTGSIIVLAATYRQTVAGFSCIGEPGKPAESVATDAISDFQQFHDSAGVVDRHLADQLIPYLAIAGGAIKVADVTDHIQTNVDVVNEFGFPCNFETAPDNAVRIIAPGQSYEH